MTSQSSIIGRLSPQLGSNWRQFRKDFAYYCKYHSTGLSALLTVLGIFTVVGAIILGVAWGVNNGNNQTMIRESKLYHYAIGSIGKCNQAGDQAIDNNSKLASEGWFSCKFVAVTKNNEYYTASYWNPETHKQETYKFQIQYVSNK